MTARVTLVVSGLASPPVNTVAPAVTGTAVVGQQLSCTTGTWTGSPAPTFTYQWKRNGATIGGAMASTYTLVQADAGNTANIKCTVTATNSAGAVPADSNTVVQVLDAEASAYITSASALFPDAVNTLCIDLKAQNLWDLVGSLKFGFGVSSLSNSLIDLRNTAFNGTAVNTPTQSATAGWTFTAASSQYIDTGWKATAANSKASQNSIHFGLNIRSVNTGNFCAAARDGSNVGLDYQSMFDGAQEFRVNSTTTAGGSSPSPAYNPVSPKAYITTRTASNTVAMYGDGALKQSFTINSNGNCDRNVYIGARNNIGTADGFTSGRYSWVHFGAALDAAQASGINTLLAAYAAACGAT